MYRNLPNIKRPYARGPGESEYPELWRGLVGAWPFGMVGGGNSIHDFSNHGSVGTFIQSPTWVGSSRGRVVRVNESDKSAIEVADSGLIDNTSHLTISAWVYSYDNSVDQQGILAKNYKFSTSNAYYWNTRTTGGHINLVINNVNLGGFIWPNAIVVNEWRFLTMVFNGDESASNRIRVYNNAKLAATINCNDTSIISSSENLLLGARRDGATRYCFNGLISDVNIFRRVLSQNDINILYNIPYVPFVKRRRIYAFSAGGATLTPAAVAIPVAAVAPQLNIELRPAAVAAPILSAAPQLGAQIRPFAVASALAVPTVQVGAQVQLGAASLAFITASPQLNAQIRPSAAGTTLAAPAITLSTGATTLTPSAVATPIAVATPSLSSTQVAIPDETVSAGGWTSVPSGSLQSVIDEATPNDSDYIESGNNPTNDQCDIGLSNLSDPASSSNHIISYRYLTNGGGRTLNLIVSLRQGASTEIASWTHNGISSTVTQADQTLSGAQADSISDYTDLRLRFDATSTGGGSATTGRVTWAKMSIPSVMGIVTPTPIALPFATTTPTLNIQIRPSVASSGITPAAPQLGAQVRPAPVAMPATAPSVSLQVVSTLAPSAVSASILIATPQLNAQIRPDSASTALATTSPQLNAQVRPNALAAPVSAVAVALFTGSTLAPSPIAALVATAAPQLNAQVRPIPHATAITPIAPQLGAQARPNALATPIATGAVTLLTGSNIAPSPVSMTLALTQPQINAQVRPSPIASAVAAPAPTLLTGGAVAPTPIATALVAAAPQLGAQVRPTAAASSMIISAPQLNTEIRPTPVALPIAATTSTLLTGNVVQPNAVSIPIALGAAQLNAGLAIPALAMTIALPQPTLNISKTPAPVSVALNAAQATTIYIVNPATAGLAFSPTGPQLNIALAPGVAASTMVMPAPALLPGAIALSMGSVAAALSVPSPAIVQGALPIGGLIYDIIDIAPAIVIDSIDVTPSLAFDGVDILQDH